MRNRLLVSALAAIFVLLLASVLWWSRHPSTADVTAAPERATLAPANLAVAPPASLPPGGRMSPPDPSKGGLLFRPAASPPRGAGTTLVAPVPGANSLPASATALADTDAGRQAGMIDLDKARRMIRDYHTLMGENPVGTNAEIMKAIMGHNLHQATLGPVEGQQLNEKGELIDQWGTPFFFHQLSGDHMEIHSAGPDKIMGTKDDLVLP